VGGRARRIEQHHGDAPASGGDHSDLRRLLHTDGQQRYDAWVGDTDHVTDPDASPTTVTMPAGNVEVTASYTDLPSCNYWPGDLNEDEFVGQTDLDIVLDMWGKSGPDHCSDFRPRNLLGTTASEITRRLGKNFHGSGESLENPHPGS